MILCGLKDSDEPNNRINNRTNRVQNLCTNKFKATCSVSCGFWEQIIETVFKERKNKSHFQRVDFYNDTSLQPRMSSQSLNRFSACLNCARAVA